MTIDDDSLGSIFPRRLDAVVHIGDQQGDLGIAGLYLQCRNDATWFLGL